MVDFERIALRVWRSHFREAARDAVSGIEVEPGGPCPCLCLCVSMCLSVVQLFRPKCEVVVLFDLCTSMGPRSLARACARRQSARAARRHSAELHAAG